MPATSFRRSTRLALALAIATTALVSLLGLATSAHAGSYTVTGSCAWLPWSGTPAVHVYASPNGLPCPALSIAAEGTGTAGSAGGWTFYAPASPIFRG
jgi:hypothetical protein